MQTLIEIPSKHHRRTPKKSFIHICENWQCFKLLMRFYKKNFNWAFLWSLTFKGPIMNSQLDNYKKLLDSMSKIFSSSWSNVRFVNLDKNHNLVENHKFSQRVTWDLFLCRMRAKDPFNIWLKVCLTSQDRRPFKGGAPFTHFYPFLKK